jgi:uncharacterized protein (DUF433 family)
MREDEEKADERTYTWALDPVTGVALLDPVTGDPYLVASRPRTPQEIADDEVVDAIWQKLYDNPSLDPEMWNLMFGPEPEEELTEEQIEEMGDRVTPAQANTMNAARNTHMAWTGYDTIDWSGCDEVEQVEGKKGGVPILKHTRMQADLVLDNYQAGLSAEEIAEVYLLDARQVKAVIDYGLKH